MGAVRSHAHAVRTRPLARKGVGDWRAGRVAPPPPAHPRAGAVPPDEHPRSAGLRFLRHLARHVRGPVILVWDRGNPHKHQLVRAWLATHPRWDIVWFPPYAPELNPVELLWGYLKYGRLANFAPDTVDEIRSHVRRERRRLGRRPQLLRSFFRHSALPFRV